VLLTWAVDLALTSRPMLPLVISVNRHAAACGWKLRLLSWQACIPHLTTGLYQLVQTTQV
jgi:hypothetical protein